MRRRTNTRDTREFWPSDNGLGMPSLLPSMLAVDIPTDLVAYRSGRYTPESTAGKALTFFVDDWRFAGAWTYPSRVLDGLTRAEWPAVCEPNFSLWSDAPTIEQLWATYRQRWCGRYWQENGVKIIPTINFAEPESYAFVWIGIPDRPPIVAVETQTSERDVAGFNHGISAACEQLQPQSLLVYGRVQPFNFPRGVEVYQYQTQAGRMRARLQQN